MDAENLRHNMMMYERLVCYSHGADSGVILISDDTQLKQQLMRDHHYAPISGHLGAYCMVGSLSSCYYWWGLYANCKDYCKKYLTCYTSKVST